MSNFKKKGLTPKSENIADWYHDLVVLGDLADYSNVKGSMIIKPYGYAIWEKVQQFLDARFKEAGVQNLYFPLLIPMSLLQKEKDHLEGFSPELAVVTHAGGEELSEPYAVRPTSETIMYDTFSKWVQSYRDLPLLTNQWCNVVRWEKRTNPFLRTSEFLWQEGHTVHQTSKQAHEMVMKALEWYKDFYEQIFAISPYVGLKSESEKFAGAYQTYTIELVMPDGKALQAATSHDLADNFSKVFGIEFLNEQNEKENPYQTSWGLSTRSIGGLVLVHGDDSGLVLPPNVAPIQVVICVMASKEQEKQSDISMYAKALAQELQNSGIRIKVDDRIELSLGNRANEWELKGVPVRFEIGPKEIEANKISYTRRDNFEKGQLDTQANNLPDLVEAMLIDIQRSLLQRSLDLKESQTKEASNFEEFKQILTGGKAFIRAFWCEEAGCEKAIKDITKATTRCIELENLGMDEQASCVRCEKPARRKWLFAQSY